MNEAGMRLGHFSRALSVGALLMAGSQIALAQAVSETNPESVTPTQAAFEAPAAPIVTLDMEALQSALAEDARDFSEAEQQAIAEFYEARAGQPFWSAEDGVALRALTTAAGEAGAQGLPPARYSLEALEAAGDNPVLQELAAMRAYLQLGGDLTAGIVRPSRIDEEISIRPERATAETLLAALTDQSVTDALRSLEPQDPDYRALMAEKARLSALSEAEGLGAPVPSGPSLRMGESSPRVAALRARLERLGYNTDPVGATTLLPVNDETTESGTETTSIADTSFDEGLDAALKTFQRDQGLIDDGVAGRRTLAALNVSVADRIRNIDVNLERMRWMNIDLGARRIEVNIPDYSVEMIDDGDVVWSSRTVVGEVEETRTPEFSDEMTYFVVNPTWHIPDSIAMRDYLPQLRTDPQVLARKDMSLYTRSGVRIDPALVDFSQYTSESFPFRVKQNPSAANALGRVKFMFPNQYSIYLHDTPSRQYFNRDHRALSNGCIRLEKPLELAHVLLEGQVSDPVASFDGWLETKSERYVNLDRPVQVHLMYRTVFVDADGKIRYREDIYGRDAKVFSALEAQGVRLPDAAQG
ncbi:MAG: L,D-transpeptidase family protein [Pseudomonadota bacterium]